jgi:phosphoglucosamine mutase
MGQRRWFGTDGIRGRVGRAPMTPEFVAAAGAAAGKFFAQGKPGGKVVVARDTRGSGPELEAALAAGLESAGMAVLRVGVMPSGAAAMVVPALGACAGAVLSASHNPAEDNGLKFFHGDGRKLEDGEEEQIEAQLEIEHAPRPKTAAGKPDFSGTPEAREVYRKKLQEGFGSAFSLKGLKILVDAANGAAWQTTPEFLQGWGVEVEAMGNRPDGSNINEGCGSEHPEKLMAAVKARKGWIGLAHDGDADRLVLVDEEGERVDGDEVIAMAAVDALERGALPGKTVVATVMSNLGLDEAMAAKGGKVKRTPVGDRYVAAAMREGGFTVGGEASGHLLFTDISPAGDGLLSALKILDLMKRKGQPLSQLRQVMKRYPQKLVNLKVRHKPAWESVPPLAAAVREMEKFLGRQGRILLRYSGTEPKVRLLVEADEEDKIRKVQERLVPVLREHLGE